MKIRPVKGTRDFYPQEMAVRNWIIDGWKNVSIRNGFEEYDGPIFEYLKMFQVKSGDEIVEQLFSLTDRGGRELALRPEMTPTLARMVNQQINSLRKPIKWFSVPRLFRAERPQKGRLREFFQWNIDIIGVEDVLADAEVIFTTIDYLRQIGLTKKDIKVKISSRKFLAGFLKGLGIQEKRLGALYVLLDKSAKLSADVFEELLIEQIPEKAISDKILEFMTEKSSEQMTDLIGPDDNARSALDEINHVFEYLENMGVSDFCVFDPGIVRGLAYYTGIVFEVHDAVGELRAVCGGGRYDNLLKDFGGPSIPATGMGMGDCVLEVLLREKGLIDEQLPLNSMDFFIAYANEVYKDEAVKVTMKLRSKGQKANFSYKAAKLNKQLKQASEKNARMCIIIGDEFKDNNLVLKDMSNGRQQTVQVEVFLKEPETFIE